MNSLANLTLQPAQISRFRLARHLLGARAAGGPEVAAAAAGGLQAQVLSAAELQAWSRLAEPRRGDLAKGLWERRSLVRTWAMRGTLHVFAAEDLPQVLAATPPFRFSPAWLRAFEVSQEQLERLEELLLEALDGRCLARAELAEAVGRTDPELGRHLLSGWGSLLKPAARQGLIVQGPPRGQQTTFVRTDQWLPGAPSAPAAGPRQWARRYLSAYGPATAADYARWMGLRQVAAARAAFAELGEELVQVRAGGRAAFALAADLPLLSDPPPAPVRLLAGFDPYLLGHVDRDHVIPAGFRSRISRTSGWISPVVLADGVAVATWSHRTVRGLARLEVAAFGRLPAAVRAGLKAEAERLAAFVGTPVALTYT